MFLKAVDGSPAPNKFISTYAVVPGQETGSSGRASRVPALAHEAPLGMEHCALESMLVPVIPQTIVTLEEDKLRRLREIAARIATEEPSLAATQAFGPRTRPGILAGRWLVIGDTTEIALAKIGEESTYEYRLSLLARRGDLVVFSEAPHSSFEDYRSQIMGLGPVRAINPRRVPDIPLLPLADRCRIDRDAFFEIVESVKREGSLTIVPQIGLGSVWRLAGAVAEETGLDVRVMSSPPRLTSRINDKLWFTRLAGDVVGENAIPPTYSAHGLAALALRIRALARTAERVVVKVPDSAGAVGNICLAAHEVADAALSDIKDRVLAILRAVGWRDTYPLLVGLWEAPALSSPSVQLWIPSISEGPPIIEGLFEQLLEGSEGLFVGSVPAVLPERWRHRVAEEAMRLATVLQFLGYFGRCSLDALLVGQTYDSAVLHWIECNGRWGGVSIPMTIVNRLTRGRANRTYIVAHRTGDSHPRHRFTDALRILDGILYKPGVREEGIILLSPVEIETGRGVQMLACARTIAAARKLSDRGIEILSESQCRGNA